MHNAIIGQYREADRNAPIWQMFVCLFVLCTVLSSRCRLDRAVVKHTTCTTSIKALAEKIGQVLRRLGYLKTLRKLLRIVESANPGQCFDRWIQIAPYQSVGGESVGA